MSGRLAALLGIIGAAALSVWLKRKRIPDNVLLPDSTLPARAADIDDDTAADIIRRAKPALERAREVEEANW